MPVTLDSRNARMAALRSGRIGDGLSRGMRLLHHRSRLAWLSRTKVPPADWSHKRLRLDSTREASSKYDLERRPWWRAILECFADPEVRSIAVPAATQVGKTLALIAAILWCAENSPAPGMIVLPDRDAAIEFRDRVYGTALATLAQKTCDRLRVPPEHDWNTRYIDLGSMRVYLAWSGSRQRLRGRPCRFVWLSEVDVYKGDKKAGNPIAAAHQRTKAFFRGLHYHESSPSEYPSTICEIERHCTARYRWQCECPQCGLWQELRFFLHTKGEHAGGGGIGGLKDGAGEYVSAETARKNAHYVCEAGCIIGNEQKQAMLEVGAWVPLGAKIRGVDAGGNPILEGKLPTSRRDVGFHLWSIHSEATTFGDLAAAYIIAKETGKLPEFWGNWLGLEYRTETKLPSWSKLGQRLAWSHPRGTVPPEAWFLTAGADMQSENKGVRCSIRGWAPGCTSWLIDWFWIERTPGDENDLVKSDLVQLSKLVLERRFPVFGGGKNPLGRRELPVRLLLIDTNYLPMKVHHWMQSLPEPWIRGDAARVRAIRGDHQIKGETRWRRNLVETNTRTGEKYEGGLDQWGLFVYPFYSELTEKISGEPNKVGSWYVTSDCLTLGKSYLEQVVNFGQTFKVDPATGRKKQLWGPINGRIPVDYWDTEIYSQAAAHMTVGDVGWDAQKWADRWLKKPDNAQQPKRRRVHEDLGRDGIDLDAR